MKAIMISIRPEWVAEILNGNKIIEIRKRFPKNYVGWVYIYCTKDKKIFLRDFRDKKKWAAYWRFVAMENDPSNVGELPPILNGKVVARFWCDKVEEIFTIGMYYHETKTLDKKELLKNSCLSQKELDNYLQGKNGTAIHITNLEIFDEPKEISEFDRIVCGFGSGLVAVKPLTRAPQSWCYIEI